MLFVQKYGGTSLAGIERLRAVTEQICRDRAAGHSVIAIVSAMGEETDHLLEQSAAFGVPPPRELDHLLACGEQKSAALLSMSLNEKGVSARAYAGWQVPLQTDDHHGRARIRKIDTKRLRRDIRDKTVPIVTGFQGVNENGDITTLGRGGSDTSAVAMAVAFGADECQIYTDVDGIYTADPRLVRDARLLGQIFMEEMLELAALGSRVLEPRSVALAAKNNVNLRVLSAFGKPGESPGTLIMKRQVRQVKRGDKNMEESIVSGIAHNKSEAKITVNHVPDKPGVASRILGRISEEKIDVDMIVQNVGSHGATDFTFTLHRNHYRRACNALKELREELSFKSISGDTKIAKISLVGLGMRSHSGVAARMFAALAKEGINIQVISTSEIRVSVIIEEKYTELAVRCLHEEFNLKKKS